MKKTATLVTLVTLFSLDVFSQSLMWSNEVTVAMGSMYGNVRPRVAATANNIPVVMWGGGMSTEPAYAARWNGTSFSGPLSVTPMGVDPAFMTWQGPDIAANGNIVYVIFKREPEMMNNIYIVKSTDGGVTWGDTVQVDGMNGPYSRFPSIAVTDAGNPAVMFMSFDMSWNSATYVVTNSTDGGQTFGMPADASGVGSSYVCDCCPGYITTDGTTQVCTWRRNDNNRRDMWAGVSTNSGSTFPVGIDVDNTDWMISSCPSSGPVPYISGDSLTTVFMSGAAGNNRIYISTFSISSQMEGFQMELASNISSTADQNYPTSDGTGDTLMVVWQQLDGTNVNVYYSWSVTGAAGLIDNAVLLNSSTSGNQQNPHVAYSNGMFHVVFTDLASGNVIYKSATIQPNSIGENYPLMSMRAFPNPSDVNVTLDLTSLEGHSGTVTVTDVGGRVVQTIKVTGQNQVMITHQSAGVYFAEARDELTGNKLVSRVVFY